MTEELDHDEDEIETLFDETGAVRKNLLAGAVQVWSILQDRPTSLNEAALTFNLTPGEIQESVEWHPWMQLEGDGPSLGETLIVHDGA